jgi:hypothetical protein
MDSQEIESKELTEKQPETRKRKLLTASVILWAKCKVCLEPGNLENLIRHGIPIKNSLGVVLHGASEYVYFCSESCKGLFKNN